MTGKVVIDTMNPLKVDSDFQHSHDTAFMATSSTSEELQRRVPGAREVKAFSTLPSDLLDGNRWSVGDPIPQVFVAGDDADAKKVVFRLAEDAGFTALDTGPLSAALSIEQLGILRHHVADHHFSGDLTRPAPAVLVTP